MNMPRTIHMFSRNRSTNSRTVHITQHPGMEVLLPSDLSCLRTQLETNLPGSLQVISQLYSNLRTLL